MRKYRFLAVIVAACISNTAKADEPLEPERLPTDVYGPECTTCPQPPVTPAPAPVAPVQPVPEGIPPIVAGPAPVAPVTPTPQPVTTWRRLDIPIRLGFMGGGAGALSSVPSGVTPDGEEHNFLPVADGIIGAYIGVGGGSSLRPYLGLHGWGGPGSIESSGGAVGGSIGYAVDDILILGVGGEYGERKLDIDPEGFTAQQKWGGVGPEALITFTNPEKNLDVGVIAGFRFQQYSTTNWVDLGRTDKFGIGGTLAFRVGMKSAHR